jgi:hypothetical protein
MSAAGIVSAALIIPGMAQAEFFHDFELSGLISNETAFFVRDGATIGNKKNVFEANEHSAGDLWKFENRMRLFLNGGIGENSTLHAEGNFVMNPEGVNRRLQGHQLYSQYDYFRELYLDSAFGEEEQVTTRLGKQQVVWGTADGIKLLDIINPTDFRFLNQSAFEDSRIPVWMAVGEYNPTDDINLQAIVAQSRPNFIPGLDAGSDKGHPFILKGVDTITGQVDGFLNITPALGSTAAAFQGFAAAFNAPTLGAVGGSTFTVQDFVNGASPFCPGGTPIDPSLGANCAQMLNTVAQAPGLGGNENKTNLVTETYNSDDPKFTFEYMNKASFATFDTFARSQSVYRQDLEEDKPNLGFRFKQSTSGGINYSLNYYYHHNRNPSVEVFWEDKQGNKLTSATSTTTGVTGQPVTTVSLRKPDGDAFVPQDNFNENDGVATLVFREFQDRIHSAGGAFDAALDMMPAPTVLRGEFLYQKDVLVPVIDRNDLAIGDVTNALRNEKADFFKYVLGLDVTVFTNLLVSGQLIQFWNLDYIDEKNNLNGSACADANCGRYTGDPSTLSLSNGMKKGDELETFGSFFLSKPFGAEQQHRVNNIFIAENGGGFWNRLDVEYEFTQISENLIGSAALNFYFGDEDTLFGQFKDSSNFQIGLKYLFDPEFL